MKSFSAVDSILAAWAVHNEINLFLIAKIPSKGFDAVPYGSKGRTVAEQLVHMNVVRLGGLHYHLTGKRPKRESVTIKKPTRSALITAFKKYGKDIFDRPRIASSWPNHAGAQTKRVANARSRIASGIVGRWMWGNSKKYALSRSLR